MHSKVLTLISKMSRKIRKAIKFSTIFMHSNGSSTFWPTLPKLWNPILVWKYSWRKTILQFSPFLYASFPQRHTNKLVLQANRAMMQKAWIMEIWKLSHERKDSSRRKISHYNCIDRIMSFYFLFSVCQWFVVYKQRHTILERCIEVPV